MTEISTTNSCAKLLHFKDKRDILQEEKPHKNKKLYFKKHFSRETLELRKGLWNEVVRLWEGKADFAVINCDEIYSRSFWPKIKLSFSHE